MKAVNRDSVTDTHYVKLRGPLNARQADEVRQLFRDLAGQGVGRVVVDLEDVPFVDSRGLATLIAGYQIFGSQAGKFRLVGVQAQPRLVFELTGFDQVFQISGENLVGARAAETYIQIPVISGWLAARHLAA